MPNVMLVYRKPILLAFATTLAFALVPAYAEDAGGSGKKLSLIHLLVRAGKNEDAANAMRSLYPKGPPYSGELALEYYDVVGNTDNGWEEARTGLERLVKAAPEDVSYRRALAKHLSRRATTRRNGLQMFAALAKQPAIDRQQVLEEWRRALDGLDDSSASIGLYQEYLAVDPDNASVRDALADAQRAEAKRLPWQLRDKADAQLAEGHPEEAMTTLKNALQLDPKNAWVRFDLSRLYHKQGDKKQGRALMENGLSVAPGDADMLYADALYVSLLDEADKALHLLEKIPAAQRSPAMQRLKQKMTIQAQTQQAQTFARDERRADMQMAMARAETGAGSDAELVNIVANAWFDLNDPAHGVTLMQRLAAQPSPPLATRLYYAKLLNRAERDEELASVLDQLSATKGLTPEDKDDLRYLKASLAARRADNLRHAGNLVAARAVLASAREQDTENTDMLMALARVHVAAHEPQQARDIYQRILQSSPGNVGVQLALARAMGDAGDRAAAQHEMAAVLANMPADDLDTRMAITDWYIEMDDMVGARTVVEQSKKISPDNPRVLMQAERIAKAEGGYGEAMDSYEQAKVADEVTDIERRRAKGYVTTGVDYLNKPGGTPGISNLTAMEVPIEIHMPVGYSGGRAFFQVDPVSANAGALQLTDLYNLRQYGKVLALAPAGIASAPEQSAQGTTLAAGYEGDGMRADIGTTPLGFPVSDIVGGVKWSHYTATSGFSFDVSRRPVTSSLLSYAGARDPVTGEVWGGVRSSGASLHVSQDSGRLSGFVDLGYYWLNGKNVLNNTQSALRTGFDWSFISEEDMRLTAGLALTSWHYRENLRYYT
ncbi:MAG: cellulose synthase subunit BcsC-related outer membrane protein, partial [Sideroxyarcus sp.]|nr:cellulose synthase subunit BcsC-related outer membrane protein [Sideroxyarcus sp.]